MAEEVWKTALTHVDQDKIRLRGYDITELMGNISFAQAAFLLLKGELPTAAEARMMEAILVSSIDHGPTPPSILTARAVFSGGNPLNAAVAAGVLAIGEVYGGAIERCARMLQEWAGQPGTPRQIAGELVADLSKTGERLPGFGHRLHVTDPRTVRLLALAREADIRHRHVDLAVAVEAELEHRTRKRLPMNINGAVAAVISDMGFDWRLGNGFFIISRAAGLVAHVYEEWTREESMRRLDPPPHEYDGPRARRLAT